LIHVCRVRNGGDGRRQRGEVLATGSAPVLAHRTTGEGGDCGHLRGRHARLYGDAQGLEPT